jgi:phosphatidylglycerophosphate synthase
VKTCILPASAGAALEVAGLAVAERTRRAIDRAGLTAIPLEASILADGPVLYVAGDAVIEPAALRALASGAPKETGALAASDCLESPTALVVPADGGRPHDADSLATVAHRLRARDRLQRVATGDAPCRRVRTPSDAERIERELLAGLRRKTDGYFARHFDRRISSRLSPLLVRRGITPNAITAAATLVGLAGAACLAAPSRAFQLAGAVLFVVSTILDGCDGEVARLSFTSSALGHKLDLIGDNLVNAAVFLGIGWSTWQGHGGPGMLLLVWLALGGFALATLAGFAFSRWIERSGRKEELHDLYESLASRDFAYFVLLLAGFGRLHWFVGFAAVGSYAFVVFLAVVWLRRGRGPTPPAPPVVEGHWA